MKSKNLIIFNWIGVLKGFYFYIPIFTLFLTGHGVPLSAVVIANMFWSIGAFVGEVPTGVFADHYGQKLSIIFGYSLEALGILVVFLSPSVLGLYLYCAISGFAYSFLSGSEEALLYETTKYLKEKSYQKVYARFLSNEQLGYAIATALAGFVYQYGGVNSFSLLMLGTFSAFLLAAIVALFLTNYRTDPVIGSVGSGMFTTLRESFSLIHKNKTIFTLTIIGVLTVSGQYLIQAVYQPHFLNNAVPALWIGLAMSLGTLLNVLVMRSVHLFESYLSLEKILLALNLALGVLFVLMSMLLHPAFLVGIFVVMQGLFNVQAPIVSDYINPRVPSNIRTTVLSGISFAKRFFEIFIGLALGAAVGVFGIETTLIIQGVYLIVGIGIGYYLLVRCGCTYKVNEEVEQLEFN